MFIEVTAGILVAYGVIRFWKVVKWFLFWGLILSILVLQQALEHYNLSVF